MKGIQKLNLEGEQQSLKTRLNPLDNDIYSESFRGNFYGRESLMAYYDNWYKSDSKILWLVGNAGIGKTAFIANLTRCGQVFM